MKKEEIKSKLSEKYNELTTDILTNTILEYQELFQEKYLTTDMVINLVMTNIPKGVVEYDELEGSFDAVCSVTSGEFKICKDVLKDRDYFSYVFFHEFIHSISFRKFNGIQFMGFYTRYKGEEYKFKCSSFDEAFTEYLTLKRNNLVGYHKDDRSLSGYELGALQFDLITSIIPEDTLFNAYFNCPDTLEQILSEYHMNMDELFYGIRVLEERAKDAYSLEHDLVLNNPNNIYRLIDGERYIFYNLLDSFGDIKNIDEFNNKWSILLKEYDCKYNFYKIDRIFRIGSICKDMDKIGITNSDLIKEKISKEELDKYRYLHSIFSAENNMDILAKLYDIYKEDYKKYYDLFRNEFLTLAYTFLGSIENNYQFYDIEIYPRVYPYLIKENAKIEDVTFSKLKCDEVKTTIYIFTINGHNYVECNYNDTEVEKVSEDEFLFKYQDIIDKVNISSKKYITNKEEYDCITIYEDIDSNKQRR